MLFTSVNPHKGYLNTDFRIHTNCDHAISYMVYDKTETSVLEGIVHPNEHHSIKITSPGNFVVKFSDNSSINLVVEDGYCTEFFPYVPNLPDYTSYNLKLIRDVRNEYSHRSTITKTNPKSAIKIAFEKTNFSSIRRTLILLSNVIAQKLAPAYYKGIIKNILPSAVVIEFNGASVVLDNHHYSKYKGQFTLNAAVEVVARRNNILDIVI